MRSIRPHLGLIVWSLVGAAAGVGSVVAWLNILGPHSLPQWAFGLIAGPTALLLLGLAAGLQRQRAVRRRPRRRAHARPRPIETRKAA